MASYISESNNDAERNKPWISPNRIHRRVA